jgi:hypothetical protein
MQTIYLKDGRVADLITQTDKGYLVDPYITWNDYEGQPESAPSGNVEFVSEVFNTVPVDLIEAEYKKVLDKLIEQEEIWSTKQKELQQFNAEIAKLRNQKTDISRYIINREELRTAKRLILWPNSQITPRIMDGKQSHRFTISYEIDQYKNEERVWCYKLWSEDRNNGWNSSEYFDSKYGIKIDLTDEEIFTLTQERIPRFKKEYHSWQYALLHTSDEWLSADYISEKQALKKENDAIELLKAEKELKKAQENFDKLSGKSLTVS